MPDGNADVSIKPDELRALKPQLDDIKAAVEAIGAHLAGIGTLPQHFGGTPNAPEAAKFFFEQHAALADTSMAANFVQTFTDSIVAVANGHEETEKELSDKFKKIHGAAD